MKKVLIILLLSSCASYKPYQSLESVKKIEKRKADDKKAAFTVVTICGIVTALIFIYGDPE